LIAPCEEDAVPFDIGAIEPAVMPESAAPPVGAMLPGEACGAGEAIGAFVAPVGAGEVIDVWARAAPADRQIAAEASSAKRIKFS
jgi:hypothetical protein